MKWDSLSSVATITMGSAPKGDSYNFDGEGFPLIAGAGDYGEIYPNPKKWTNAPTKLTSSGDLILCIRATIGDINWADKEYCLGRGVAGIRAKDNSDILYLSHAITAFKKELMREATGSTFLQIKRSTIENFQVPLPPLAEQRRIAAILDKADAIRKKRQQAINECDNFLKSTFLEMFGDPVTNPKGWSKAQIKDISAKIQIGPFGSQLHQSDYIEGGIPLINPKHIINTHIIPQQSFTISEDKYMQLPNYHLYEGDIIMGRRGEMGRCALITATEDGWFCGTGSLYVRPNSDIVDSTYLLRVLSGDNVKSILEHEALGITMMNLNKGIIQKLSILLPPIEIQQKFAKIVKKTEALKSRMQESQKELDDNFNALTQLAFKGEL